MFVLHCDVHLQSAMWLACPWWSDGFWSKVTFVSRVEFLWESFNEVRQAQACSS